MFNRFKTSPVGIVETERTTIYRWSGRQRWVEKLADQMTDKVRAAMYDKSTDTTTLYIYHSRHTDERRANKTNGKR